MQREREKISLTSLHPQRVYSGRKRKKEKREKDTKNEKKKERKKNKKKVETTS